MRGENSLIMSELTIEQLLDEYLNNRLDNVTVEEVSKHLDDPDPLKRRVALELLYNLTGDANYLMKIMPLLQNDVAALWDFLNDYCSSLNDRFVVSVLIMEALKYIDPVKEHEKAGSILFNWRQLNPPSLFLPDDVEDASKIKDLEVVSLPVIANVLANWIALGVKQLPFSEFHYFPYFLANHSGIKLTIPEQYLNAISELPDKFRSHYDLGVMAVIHSDLKTANKHFIEAAREILSRDDPANAFNIVAKWHTFAGPFLNKHPDLLADLEDILWKVIHEVYIRESESLQVFVMSIFLYCDIASKLIGYSLFNYQHILELSELFEKKILFFKMIKHIEFKHEIKPKDNLNIGFIAFSLNEGPAGSIVNNFIRHHDKYKFKIFFYDCGFAPQITALNLNEMQKHATVRLLEYQNHDEKILDAVNFASQIHEDQIDILIYLDWLVNPVGHAICCLKPAPLNVKIDLVGITSGLSKIPYMIDYLGIAKDSNLPFTEELIEMPLTFPMPEEIESFDGISSAILGNKTLMYSFVAPENLETEDFKEAIVKILARNQDAHFSFSSRCDVRPVLSYFDVAGVADRVTYLGTDSSRKTVCENIRLCDIYLNPYPLSGRSDVYYAMTRGKPVVALSGTKDDLLAKRIGAKILNEPDIIAQNYDEYVEKASRLIQSPDLRSETGNRLAERASNEFNSDNVVKKHEELYRELYNRLVSEKSSV